MQLCQLDIWPNREVHKIAWFTQKAHMNFSQGQWYGILQNRNFSGRSVILGIMVDDLGLEFDRGYFVCGPPNSMVCR